MNTILPIILVVYLVLFGVRYFVIRELNSKKLLPNNLKENSITFIKMKDAPKKDKGAQLLYKKYNIITSLLWVVTLVVIVIVIGDNIGRL
ncbi:hypothetical protein [Mangrovibacterium sp.]|uniref:hypothetical protein n=1 Tax=Mangrovibacterium sp. TaxID=1961364 RepID=UPI003561B210